VKDYHIDNYYYNDHDYDYNNLDYDYNNHDHNYNNDRCPIGQRQKQLWQQQQKTSWLKEHRRQLASRQQPDLR
jgi:hypothetical protein